MKKGNTLNPRRSNEIWYIACTELSSFLDVGIHGCISTIRGHSSDI